jgi:predicted CxxxxCH...CXXCH cytochrome family protein
VGHPQNTSCGTCHVGYTSSSVNVATHVNGIVEVVAVTCTTCHGTAGRTGTDPTIAAAPPTGTRGETLTSARAVGAHLKHLQDGAIRQAVACAECHVVPAQQIHADGAATVTFGTLARTGSTTPVWSGTTCASTYCHGATLGAGGSLVTPSWTTVDGTQAACGTCHAVPPPQSSGHPAVAGNSITLCASCHPATMNADGTVKVSGGKHVNGTVDVAGQGCTSCHGDASRAMVAGGDANLTAAPPAGTHGETATTSRAVGAHQSHVVAGNVRAPISCSECHVVPSGSNGHPAGTVNVTWGSLATAGPTAPVWNGTNCAATYCHGATLGAGGTANTPIWTTVDGTQRQCTSCHGAPPSVASGHPSVGAALTGCAACHPATVKADGSIDIAGGKHVNGTLEVSGGCTSCHGDPNRSPASIAAAPPRDTQGSATSAAVGAHLAHLTDGALRSAVACSDCHTVPSDSAHATQPLDLTWGTLARTGGVTPSWNATSLTCTNYCHGITLFGGSDTTPQWNLGSSQAACGTCHGLPPTRAVGASQHPPVQGGVTACSTCHPETVSNTGSILLANGKHIDGLVELDTTSMTCTTCHGDSTRVAVAGADASVTSAPPVGTHGETLTTDRAVGAHQAHLNRATFASPIACAECHSVPATMNHANGTVTVTFGTLAKTGGVTPAWNGSTCATTACHAVNTSSGASAGGSNRTPVWTTGTMNCTTCHGNPPSTGHHATHQSQNKSCASCHGAGYTNVYQATGTLTGTVNLPTHVNGSKELLPSVGAVWNATHTSITGCTNGAGCHNGQKGPW